jgi:diguanylate cyclase (GGDEF)-like protein
MNPSRLLHAFPSRWLDWKRRDTRDALVLVGVGIISFIVSDVYELPPHLLQFGLEHADWDIDDIIFVVFILSIAMLIYGFRRYQDLSREIKARTAAELEARNLARHDPLTGLPNRRFFEEKLAGHLHLASDARQVAVLMLDLDGFKQINDAHGHMVGDKALCEFATRVLAVLPAEAFLARLGGDEFAIIMPAIGSLDEPANLARRVAATVAEPFVLDHVIVKLGVGIGIVVAPNDGKQADDLLRRGDRALYRAKAAGQSSVRFFEAGMDAHFERRIQIERELRSAVDSESDVIIPYYQPLVALKDNHIVGFEALARWHSKSLGFVAPDVFIPIAEETRLINPLGDRLFRHACLDAASWPGDLILAFNVSAVQLRDPSFGLRLLSILAATGFNPHRLEIEITETALVENLDIVRTVIDELRQAGVRIALDDFGTGYATLSQLLSFQFDKIKIDKSFVARLDQEKDGQVIIRAILGLAKGFGLTTTAEGVEDKEQLSYLRASGCTEGQGYLFSKAIPASDVPALLDQPSRNVAAA